MTDEKLKPQHENRTFCGRKSISGVTIVDNEQILLNLYKQQQYDETRSKLQIIFMIASSLGSAIALIGTIIYFTSWWYAAAFGGMVLCVVINTLLVWRKQLKLNTASYITTLYAGFVFIPTFWNLTGITGSAPFVSLIILVSIITLYPGKTLKWLLPLYLFVLMGLTVYSALIGLPKTEYSFTLGYNIAGYTSTIGAVVLFMLFKLKEFNELNDRFLRSSFKDELTQLYNRKLLNIIMEYQESLYKREHLNYILVMFDVDDFKKMNDEHGHVFGDIVLRSVAECIHETTRGSDFVVRYGGDEFLVILSNASDTSTQTFIQRIEKLIQTSCQLDIHISVSFGYAARSECETPEAVLKLADERLYEIKAIKNAGR